MSKKIDYEKLWRALENYIIDNQKVDLSSMSDDCFCRIESWKIDVDDIFDKMVELEKRGVKDE